MSYEILTIDADTTEPSMVKIFIIFDVHYIVMCIVVHLEWYRFPFQSDRKYNKLKSLKVAQMYGCVDDGVCDVMWDVVCDILCDVDAVCDGVSGGEGSGNVNWLILWCLGVLVTDWKTDGQTNGHWWL